MVMNVQTIVFAMSIPSAITAFCFWMLQRTITKRDAELEEKRKKRQEDHEEQERQRDKLLYLIVQTTNASLGLSEATALAVQKIPDAHCNGEMDKALEYARDIKHDQKDFITENGIKKILRMD